MEGRPSLDWRKKIRGGGCWIIYIVSRRSRRNVEITGNCSNQPVVFGGLGKFLRSRINHPLWQNPPLRHDRGMAGRTVVRDQTCTKEERRDDLISTISRTTFRA